MKRVIFALTVLGFASAISAPLRSVAAEEEEGRLRWEGVWGFQDCFYPCSPSNP